MPEQDANTVRDPLEIGKEYPPAGEEQDLTKLRQLHLAVHQKTPGPEKRGEHPKGHGGVWAFFEVIEDIPQSSRVGIFAKPGNFTALVRFSNGRQQDDRLPDVHGLAIKLFVPQGDGTEPPVQQDFILADHPIFFARNVAHILDFLAKTASGTPAQELAVSTHPKLIGYTKVAESSPLALTYWSQTPYQLGKGAVKYVVRPGVGQGALDVPLTDSPDRLREAMVEQLTYRKVGASLELFANPQTDAKAMPIEDPTVEWTSDLVLLARISIYPQKFDSAEQMTFVENLSWTPWNHLDGQRPLGGINRARRPIYNESLRLRRNTNQVGTLTATGREAF